MRWYPWWTSAQKSTFPPPKPPKQEELKTALPKVPTPTENGNKEWARKFHLESHIGKDPASFNLDTHH